jgi:hypothetical protein
MNSQPKPTVPPSSELQSTRVAGRVAESGPLIDEHTEQSSTKQLDLRMNPPSHTGNAAKVGIGFGSALAITISWSINKSILWAIFHGFLSWVYVIYYALKYL